MSPDKYLVQVTLIVIYLLPSHLAVFEPIISIKQGRVKGLKMIAENRAVVFAFLGIPYAVPPLGKYRFAAPEKHAGWPGDAPFNANEFGPSCIQPQGELVPDFSVNPRQDEDCLQLNVWTAESSLNYRNSPVVIFLEGEGFVTGYPGRFPGQDLAAEGIVIVSVSYRLNVFGFLCLEHGGARGNVGLLDQYLALLWVRENIDAFGGDSRSVTLMGHSAGAASIGYHMVSPRTQGLFHRVIVMSGSATSPWAMSKHPSNSSFEIARSLGCLSRRPYSVLSCLRSKSSSEILKAYETQYMNGNWSELPLPVVDKFLPEIEQYLPIKPIEALKKGDFLKIPVITGVTRNEGSLVVSQLTDLLQHGYSQLKHLFVTSVIPSILSKYNFTNSHNIKELKAILNWYYIDSIKEGDVMALITKLIDIYSDTQFRAPHMRQLLYLSDITNNPRNTVYAYEFDQEDNHLYRNLNISGSGHGEELLMLFSPSLIKSIGRLRLTSSEERLSNMMKRYWLEFIRKGNIGANGYGVSWKRYSSAENNYIIFGSGDNLQSVMRNPLISRTEDAMFKQSVSLWNNLLNNLNNVKRDQEVMKHDSKRMKLTSDVPYRSAMYTLIAFVIVLLVLLVVCVVLLKRHATERERDMF
ncbi:carboxylesterase 4A isoform X2 [Rhodnius prolixus]